MDQECLLPVELYDDYAASTPEEREALTRVFAEKIAAGVLKEKVVAEAVEAGWGRGFAQWLFEEVRKDPAVRIAPLPRAASPSNANRYLVLAEGGEALGPLTVDELNAEIGRERIRLSPSSHLQVFGSSITLAARQIEGLVPGKAIPVGDSELAKTDRSAAWLMGGITLFVAVNAILNALDKSTAFQSGIVLYAVLGGAAAQGMYWGRMRGFVMALIYLGISLIVMGLLLYRAKGAISLELGLAGVPYLAVFGYGIYRLIVGDRPIVPTATIAPALIEERRKSSTPSVVPPPEAPRPVHSAPPHRIADGVNLVGGLERLAELRKQGLLSDAEFARAKEDVLSRGSRA